MFSHGFGRKDFSLVSRKQVGQSFDVTQGVHAYFVLV